jgi:transposase
VFSDGIWEDLAAMNAARHDWIAKERQQQRQVHGIYQRTADIRISPTDPDATPMRLQRWRNASGLPDPLCRRRRRSALDRAGWHTSLRLRVPNHVYLHFVPSYSPELQPAEHLWPLTNAPLINRHFSSIEDLEEAQAQHCVALQAQPALVRSTTLFHWWPQRLHKRHTPRRK